jgi:RNA polymerase sigma factor (sigma-70 family)
MTSHDRDPDWERALGGDAAAREELTQRALAIAARVLLLKGAPRSEIENLAQETGLRVLAALDDGKEVRSFDYFVKYKARGLLGDLRRRHPSRAVDMDSGPDPVTEDPGPEGEAASRERSVALADCLSQLTEALWSVVRRRYQEGLGVDEVAAELGIEPGKVSVRTCRAVKRIRACMMSKGYQG